MQGRVFGLLVVLLGAGNAWAEDAMRTVEVTPDKVEQGKALFSLCAPCHAPAEGQTVAHAAHLDSKTFLEAASDSMIVDTILKGRPGTAMVAWSPVLTKAQAEAVVAFLRDRTKTQPAKLDESPVKGDTGRGAEVFVKSCVTCHNMSGGHREWGTGILRKGFQAAVTPGYLRYIIKHGKSGTAMQPFAKGTSPLPELNLTPEQIEDVVTFLRKGI
ncbi:MAG: c-type cytochrome [Myxococcales bacterium]|nr:c-type cytochrome [Myxococcales bacterium]